MHFLDDPKPEDETQEQQDKTQEQQDREFPSIVPDDQLIKTDDDQTRK